MKNKRTNSEKYMDVIKIFLTLSDFETPCLWLLTLQDHLWTCLLRFTATDLRMTQARRNRREGGWGAAEPPQIFAKFYFLWIKRNSVKVRKSKKLQNYKHGQSIWEKLMWNSALQEKFNFCFQEVFSEYWQIFLFGRKTGH